jgi:glutathione S-transferase
VHHLVGIAFSHFVEKARFGLDRYEVPYRESRYLPVFHMPFAAWASRGRGRADRASSPFSTPILITDDGRRICDSAEILRYLSERFGEGELYADGEAAVLEAHFHDVLARDTRMVAYWYCLGRPAAMTPFLSNVGPVQRTLGRAAMPITERAIKRLLNIRQERVPRAVARIRDEVAAVDARLADDRPYLLGDRFSAADIAFACALAPAILVGPEEGYTSTIPALDALPDEMRVLHDELRATRAGALALRLFREERRGVGRRSGRRSAPSPKAG